MQWPEGVIPASLPNFETQARQKRYHLLAQAAKKLGIRHLFLGHHQDDQIETILMRLIRGKSGSFASFLGIAAEAPIPADAEIDSDLLKAQESVPVQHLPHGIERPRTWGLREDSNSSLPYSGSINSLDGRISLARRLDINLHRPLLRFSKARILATCKANRIPFVSDPTNFDPKITPRNAIRYLLKNHTVPRALSRESIFNIHDRALARLKKVSDEVQKLLDVAEVTCFDLRTGSVTLCLPKFPHLLGWECSATPATFLAHLLRLVSPIDDYEASHFSREAAASSIFSNDSVRPLRSGVSASVATFAVNQVLISKEGQGRPPYQQSYFSWRLSRQPFTREQKRRLSRTFVCSSDLEDGSVAEFWSNSVCWDRRYCIRICSTDVQYLQSCAIRPFQPSDATNLHKTMNKDSREALAKLLHDAAPGKVRYTLPVIVDDIGVKAFPTLDFAVPEHERGRGQSIEDKPMLLSWKVKYKYIDRTIIEKLIIHDSSSDRYRAAAEEYLQDPIRSPEST